MKAFSWLSAGMPVVGVNTGTALPALVLSEVGLRSVWNAEPAARNCPHYPPRASGNVLLPSAVRIRTSRAIATDYGQRRDADGRVCNVTAPSGIDEPRLALFHEGRCALGGVLCLKREGGEIGLDLQALLQRQVERSLHGRAREGEHG